MTNTEKLRAMSDDDLATWLAEHCECEKLDMVCDESQLNCWDCWLYWLWEEANDD